MYSERIHTRYLGPRLETGRRLIVQDPKATRPYLFSDGQNMYNRVVLVCTVNVYIPASLVQDWKQAEDL